MTKILKNKTNHIYPRIKNKHPVETEQAYQNALKEYNSWSIEERENCGFGKDGGHPHPRRLFIFLSRYFNELKYFMSDQECKQFVLPWICATRSERLKALSKSKVYYEIKKTTLKLAKQRYTIAKNKIEIQKLK